MGPTNVALVKLFRADQELRAAQGRLDAASRSVRVQERRIADLNENLTLLQSQLREQQARAGQLDLDIKAREARIEKFRAQQQNATNHKEYQAFLTEINTEKIDKAKVEDEMLKVMEIVESLQPRIKDLTAQIEAERAKLASTEQQLGAKLAELQSEVGQREVAREETAKGVPARAMDTFDRLAERFDGEAMAAIGKPYSRREEYVCTACNMSLVADIYNRLHARDDMVFCPNCLRLLYIPDDLPPEAAINRPKERREPREKAVSAAIGRQTLAADISRSVMPEEDDVPSPAGDREHEPHS